MSRKRLHILIAASITGIILLIAVGIITSRKSETVAAGGEYNRSPNGNHVCTWINDLGFGSNKNDAYRIIDSWIDAGYIPYVDKPVGDGWQTEVNSFRDGDEVYYVIGTRTKKGADSEYRYLTEAFQLSRLDSKGTVVGCDKKDPNGDGVGGYVSTKDSIDGRESIILFNSYYSKGYADYEKYISGRNDAKSISQKYDVNELRVNKKTMRSELTKVNTSDCTFWEIDKNNQGGKLGKFAEGDLVSYFVFSLSSILEKIEVAGHGDWAKEIKAAMDKGSGIYYMGLDKVYSYTWDGKYNYQGAITTLDYLGSGKKKSKYIECRGEHSKGDVFYHDSNDNIYNHGFGTKTKESYYEGFKREICFDFNCDLNVGFIDVDTGKIIGVTNADLDKDNRISVESLLDNDEIKNSLKEYVVYESDKGFGKITAFTNTKGMFLLNSEKQYNVKKGSKETIADTYEKTVSLLADDANKEKYPYAEKRLIQKNEALLPEEYKVTVNGTGSGMNTNPYEVAVEYYKNLEEAGDQVGERFLRYLVNPQTYPNGVKMETGIRFLEYISLNAKLKGKTSVLIPVKKFGYAYSVRFYDTDSENTETVFESDKYGDYGYISEDFGYIDGKTHITGKDGKYYDVVTDYEEWTEVGHYPAIIWDKEGKLKIKAGTYKKTIDNILKGKVPTYDFMSAAQSFDITSTNPTPGSYLKAHNKYDGEKIIQGYLDFSYWSDDIFSLCYGVQTNNGDEKYTDHEITFMGTIIIYIPVRRASEKQIQYVDVETGNTVVCLDGADINVKDDTVSYTSAAKVTDLALNTYTVANEDEYGAYPPYFAGSTKPVKDKDGLNLYNYQTASGSFDKVDALRSDLLFYTDDTEKLKDNIILFIPVKKDTESLFVVNYVDVATGKNIKSEKMPGKVETQMSYTSDSKVDGYTVITKSIANLDDPAGSKTGYAKYPPVYLYGSKAAVASYAYANAVKKFKSVTTKEDGYTYTAKSKNFKEVVVLYIPVIKTPPTYEDEYTIIKHPQIPEDPGPDDDPDTPNTMLAGLDPLNKKAAPNVFTYNTSAEFNLGGTIAETGSYNGAIPTTESFTNGVDIDTWYGYADLKRKEANYTTTVNITATQKYYVYTPIKHSFRYCYSKTPKYRLEPYEDEETGEIKYKEEFDGFNYKYKTVSYFTYNRTETTATNKDFKRIFDFHRDKWTEGKGYAYHYVTELDFKQLVSAETDNNCFENTLNYKSNITIPYNVVYAPVTKNGVNRRKEASTGQFASVVDENPKTHVEIPSRFKTAEVFDDLEHKETMPDEYKGNSGLTPIGADALTVKTGKVYDADTGETITYTYHTLNTKRDLRKEAMAKALTRAEFYYNEEFVNDESLKLTMHSDTLELNGVTYIKELGDTGGYVYESGPKRKIIGKESNDRFEKTKETTIPKLTDNHLYWTKLTAEYKAIIAPGRNVTFTMNGRGNDNTDETGDEPVGNQTEYYISPKKDAYTNLTYRMNEPIAVHSPVISPFHITDGEKKTQSTRPNGTITQLLPDMTYNVSLDWKDLFIDNNYYIKGFGQVPEAGWTKYVEEKEVRFPFPVMIDGTYYPLNVAERYGEHNVKFTDWIKLNEAKWKSFSFYLPTWAETGVYDESYGSARKDRKYNSIEVRVWANNSARADIENYHLADRTEAGYEYNVHRDMYAAIYKYPVQVNAIAFDFEVITVNDQTSFGGDDRMFDNLYNFVEQKKDRKVGIYNRFGGNTIRYTLDQAVTSVWDEKDTLPFTIGKAAYPMNGLWKLGEEVSFSLKTISGLVDGVNDYIKITPNFRYYDKNGKCYEQDELRIYYDYAKEQFLEIGNAALSANKDSIKSALLSGRLCDNEFYGARPIFKFGVKPGTHWYNFYDTSAFVLNGKSIDDISKAVTQYGRLSELILPSTTMLFTGDEAQLKTNETLSRDMVKRYNDTLGLESIGQVGIKDFYGSMQTWYGKYRIPTSLRVAKRIGADGEPFSVYDDGAIKGWYTKNGIMTSDDMDEIFVSDGYLVLNFDITLYVDGEADTTYHAGALDMWDREDGGQAYYPAYFGEFINDETDGGKLKPKDKVLAIEARSGDVAVIAMALTLGAEGAGERVGGLLYIGK